MKPTVLHATRNGPGGGVCMERGWLDAGRRGLLATLKQRYDRDNCLHLNRHGSCLGPRPRVVSRQSMTVSGGSPSGRWTGSDQHCLGCTVAGWAWTTGAAD